MSDDQLGMVNWKVLVRAPLFPCLLATGTFLVTLLIFGEFFRELFPVNIYRDLLANIVLAAAAGFFALYAYGLIAVAVVLIVVLPALESAFPSFRTKRKRILSGSSGMYFLLTLVCVLFLGVLGGTIPFALMCVSEYGNRIKLSREEIPDWAIEKARKIIEGKDA